jgi:hypothetical protein
VEVRGTPSFRPTGETSRAQINPRAAARVDGHRDSRQRRAACRNDREAAAATRTRRLPRRRQLRSLVESAAFHAAGQRGSTALIGSRPLAPVARRRRTDTSGGPAYIGRAVLPHPAARALAIGDIEPRRDDRVGATGGGVSTRAWSSGAQMGTAVVLDRSLSRHEVARDSWRQTRPASPARWTPAGTRRLERSPPDETPASQELGNVPSVVPLSAKVKLFDENAPGEIVVTAVPVTRELWPRALDAHCLAILPRAPEALLAPIAQVLPRVRASKRHASACGRISTHVGP